jgi:cytochrome b subunit of formate dehydrogenase
MMITKEPQACDVTKNRFRTVLTFLRMAGVPINMKHASILHSTYNALMTINAYALCLAFYMDIIIHNDDLKNFMKNFQALNSSLVLHSSLSIQGRSNVKKDFF